MYFTPINHLKVICKKSGSGKKSPISAIFPLRSLQGPHNTQHIFIEMSKTIYFDPKPFKVNSEQVWDRKNLAIFELLTLKSLIDWARSEQMKHNMALNTLMTSTVPIPNMYACGYNIIYEKYNIKDTFMCV